MKFSIFAIAAMLPFAWASPIAEAAHLVKRAALTDTATTGYATGTTGGVGGPTVTVSTLADLTTAVAGNASAIVLIDGTITGDAVVLIGSNKSVIGKAGASLVGVGLRVLSETNVIIRNIKISKVIAPGDAIGIQSSSKVWVDHNDLSSDRDHDKDYYDGLLDITHGCFAITASYNILHDHWKTSLVGHSDSNGAEDVAIRVTFHHNYWYNLSSRLPSFRFGQGHIYNNYYLNSDAGIETRDGAELLIQNNVFSGINKCIFEDNDGYAVATGNDFGQGANTALVGNITTVPYAYTLDAVTAVEANVLASAGATLGF